MVKGLMNPARNSSPAIAGLETERGIISNGVNLSAEFNATTGLTVVETMRRAHQTKKPITVINRE